MIGMSATGAPSGMCHTEGLEFTDNKDGTAEITGWFDSAWAPPIGAYEKFCEDMDGVYLAKPTTKKVVWTSPAIGPQRATMTI